MSGLFDVDTTINSLAANFTWLAPLSVLVASLIGSLHCVSMCGPLILNFASDRRRLFAYHSGRGISYLTAGALAGAFGQGVLETARFPWLSQLSLAFIALTLLFMGFRTLTGQGFHVKLPRIMNNASQYLWTRLRLSRWPAWITALSAGALTVFLPCGHLYGFLVGAMATGSWWRGAAFMAAFWLGTLPALAFGFAFGAKWLRSTIAPWLEKAPRLAGVVLILAGLFGVATFASRLNADGGHHHSGNGHHSADVDGGGHESTPASDVHNCH